MSVDHDPLCTDWLTGDFPGRQTCVCKLIRRVRHAERQRINAKAMALGSDGFRRGWESAREEAEAAIKALPSVTDAIPTTDSTGGMGLSIQTRTWLCNRDHALDALKRLGQR